MTSYAAWWPVHDDTATRSELIEEAMPELADLIASTGHRAATPVQWLVTENDQGPVLLAKCDVEPTTAGCAHCGKPLPVGGDPRKFCNLDCSVAARMDEAARKREALVEDVEFLLDAGTPVLDIARRVGFPSLGALEKALRRAGRTDLATPFGSEHRKSMTHPCAECGDPCRREATYCRPCGNRVGAFKRHEQERALGRTA